MEIRLHRLDDLPSSLLQAPAETHRYRDDMPIILRPLPHLPRHVRPRAADVQVPAHHHHRPRSFTGAFSIARNAAFASSRSRQIAD